MAVAEHARPGALRPDVRDRMLTLPDRFRANAAGRFAGEFGLTIDNEHYRIAIAEGRCSVRDEDPRSPSARIITDGDTWIELDDGHLSSIDAFLEDRIIVRGNVEYAVRMQSLFRPSARERTPQDLEHVTIRTRRLALSSFVFGEGSTVLLLHGLGATKLSYLPLLPALAEKHRVVVPDLPGHGESSKPRAEYTPGYFAGVVEDLLNEVGADRVALIGNSLGGRIALEVAARAPDRVSSLVLLDPAAAGLPFPIYTRLLGMLPTSVGRVPLPLRKRIVMMGIRQLFSDPGAMASAAYLAGADEFIRIYRFGRARVALLAALRGLMADAAGSFWERVEGIRAPTLILWGRDDSLVPVRLGKRLASVMRDAELVVLPGVGHVPQFEAPEATRKLILEFLEARSG